MSTAEQVQSQWRSSSATRKCLDACRDMAVFMAAIDDVDLIGMSPQLIPCLFVAARFLLGDTPSWSGLSC